MWAVWILLLPMKWLVSVVIAALIHEMAHSIAIQLLGGNVCGICLTPFGARIETENIFEMREVISALAGPAASLAVASLIHKYPVLGLCALFQGCYNLLPIYPLDGGRALRRILERILPQKYSRTVETALLLVILAAFAGFVVRYL